MTPSEVAALLGLDQVNPNRAVPYEQRKPVEPATTPTGRKPRMTRGVTRRA